MDPQPLGPSDWSQIARAVTDLYLFVALAVDAALAFLLAFAVLPSLVATLHAPTGVLRWRRVLVPLSLISIVLMLLALGRALGLAVGTLQQIYPRFAI